MTSLSFVYYLFVYLIFGCILFATIAGLVALFFNLFLGKEPIKFCKDCKFSFPSLGAEKDCGWVCKHPSNFKTSIISGREVYRACSCTTEREANYLCGESARNFVPKT